MLCERSRISKAKQDLRKLCTFVRVLMYAKIAAALLARCRIRSHASSLQATQKIGEFQIQWAASAAKNKAKQVMQHTAVHVETQPEVAHEYGGSAKLLL